MSRSTLLIIFMKILQPQRSTLFPYTTLFRSEEKGERESEGFFVLGTDAGEKFDDVRRHREANQHQDRGNADIGKENRSEEHTSELQSLAYLVCRLLLEKKNKNLRCPIHTFRR